MGYRVDKVHIRVELVIEFDGPRVIEFEFEPGVAGADDPLVLAILERNRQMVYDQARKANYGGDIPGFG